VIQGLGLWRTLGRDTRSRTRLSDGLTVVGRELGHHRRAPGQLIARLVSPAVLVVLFGYVFGNAIHVPGGDYRQYLMPGLFAMMTATSVMITRWASQATPRAASWTASGRSRWRGRRSRSAGPASTSWPAW
jgi:hypothetical protein